MNTTKLSWSDALAKSAEIRKQEAALGHALNGHRALLVDTCPHAIYLVVSGSKGPVCEACGQSQDHKLEPTPLANLETVEVRIAVEDLEWLREHISVASEVEATDEGYAVAERVLPELDRFLAALDARDEMHAEIVNGVDR